MKLFILLLFTISLLFPIPPDLEVKIREKISFYLAENKKSSDLGLASILVSESELIVDNQKAFMNILHIRYIVDLNTLAVSSVLLSCK